MPDYEEVNSPRRVAVVAMVRDEEDIIEGFVRHQLRLVDAIYIAEHHSTDRTPEILRSLVAEGLPLAVTHIEEMAQRQAECVTALMQQAFADGFTLVVALDADEFIVPDRAVGLEAVRSLLHELAPGQVHSLRVVTYQAPKSRPENFILRRAWRERQAVAGVEKVIVGQQIWQDTGLTIQQGNDGCRAGGTDEPEILPLHTIEGVHIAHFPWRSEAQVAAKAVSGWLTNVTKYTRHTSMADHWHRIFSELVERGRAQMPRLEEPTQAMLPRDWGEVKLRYTRASRGTELRRILLTAEAIADDSAQREALGRGVPVSIVLLADEDLAALGRTLASVERLGYEALQYVVAVTPTALASGESYEAELTQLLEAQPEDMTIFLAEGHDAAELQESLASVVRGHIVQYLQPGDTVVRERWEAMVAALAAHSTRLPLIVAAGAGAGAQHMELAIAGRPLLARAGDELLAECEQRQSWPAAQLSDILFCRYVLERADWLTGCLTADGVAEAALWRSVLPGNTVGVWAK